MILSFLGIVDHSISVIRISSLRISLRETYTEHVDLSPEGLKPRVISTAGRGSVLKDSLTGMNTWAVAGRLNL